MKTIIKNFLFKKRIKILKNKKGFSLMEIMVAVGLIGIITAFALPQFQSYQRNVKYGVLRSILGVAYRTAETEKTLGHAVSTLSDGFLWAKINSKAKVAFPTGGTHRIFSSSGSNWCYLLKGNTNTDYENFEGCINQAGVIKIGGANVPCSQGKGVVHDTDNTATNKTCVQKTACPTNCVKKQSVTISTACADWETGTNTQADSEQEFACEPGPTQATYTVNLSCTGGSC